MTDFENLKFAEPKAAVAEVYHIFMEIVER